MSSHLLVVLLILTDQPSMDMEVNAPIRRFRKSDPTCQGSRCSRLTGRYPESLVQRKYISYISVCVLFKLDSRNIFQDVRDEAHWTELLAVVKVTWALGHG